MANALGASNNEYTCFYKQRSCLIIALGARIIARMHMVDFISYGAIF